MVELSIPAQRYVIAPLGLPGATVLVRYPAVSYICKFNCTIFIAYSNLNPFSLSSVVDCGPLTSPDNGQVDTPQGTTLNQVATYSCNNGYLLVGSMRRTCQADGMWSGNEPFCRMFKFYNYLT